MYSNLMHDYVLRELEVGSRVAMAEDSEATGWGPLWDLIFEMDVAAGRI